MAPLHDPPAVGEQLDDGEYDHSRCDVEIVEQHSKQDHPAGHSEDAGDERRANDRRANDGESGGRHFIAA
jgi:hypothetical protein